MSQQISRQAQGELVGALRERYGASTKRQKTKILDQFVVIAGVHRKHAIRVLRGEESCVCPRKGYGRRIYGEAIREAVVILWEAGDRICGKRLKAIIPGLVDAMERHGHLRLDPEVRRCLLQASAATLDRLLRPIRKEAKPYRKSRRRRKRPQGDINVRTFSDWNNPPPGYLEIDFVEHNGGTTAGACVHSLGSVDISSGWVEGVPLLAKSQTLVTEALEAMQRQLPFRILGIDSDNESVFINDTLLAYCQDKSAEFTRSRAYRKNDQAWIEQKNGAVIRHFVGHGRYSGVVAGQILAGLYQAVRLYVNFFQPSFKLREKEKYGSKVRRYYEKPKTPCERLMAHPAIASEVKEKLELQRRALDPVALLYRIRERQEALAALVSRENTRPGPGNASLDQFMKQLGELWRQGEVRATHRTSPKKAHWWRTRKDPFEEEWPAVLLWLHDQPDSTAKELFQRLQTDKPGRFANSQLRTLQRRVRAWRSAIARGLVYANADTYSIADNPLVPLDTVQNPR